MEEEKNKGLNFISFIIALIIILIIIYFAYYSFNNVNVNNKTKLSDKEIQDLVSKKYDFLYSKRNIETNDLIFLKDESVDINNIKDEKVLYIAYLMLSKEDKTSIGQYSSDCDLSKGKYTKENYPTSCSKETFDKAILKEQITNNFSSDLKINYVDFNISSNQTCYINNNTYECYINSNPFSINDYMTLVTYDSYEYNEDTLIIYTYLLTLVKKTTSRYEAGIYSDAKALNKIDDITYYEEQTNDVINSETTKLLIEHYKSQITKHKSTFVKENNNYVWKSSERL